LKKKYQIVYAFVGNSFILEGQLKLSFIELLEFNLV